ncbi:DNA internalization-related competence protein ComEC/Rec2 [Lentibacillus sp. CBA3610]|uniref:DNA internalization-related competence protein ComEC/Rec2 n=1 Tax=Lentibacillus sp. CBA3610 TaxID=2518176 RepID=UPI001595B111|nr:DNA internalization-related competence protein ComEC/Rec2 [Lentibacillus sp. CBA3610]QKY69511.1 DNA internalization-related competence protein ComEC/Rec2 [Lentibacillus sp. CBA3610]
MKGYWHIPAFGVAASFLAILFTSKWLLAVFFFWVLYLYYDQRLGKITVLISLTFSIFAYTYIPVLEKPPEEIATSKQSTFTGQVSSSITESESRIAFEFSDDSSDSRFLIVHFKDAENEETDGLKYGATCTVHGSPEVPDASRNPGQFDYQNYLLSKGISYQVVIDSLENLECTGSSFMNRIYQLRGELLTFVQEEISPETAAWLNALVLGDDTGIEDDIIELFQRWNLSHIMAISGLHVGIVVGLVYFLLIKLNVLTKEKAQWVVIFFLPLYAWLAGGEPSVLRASAMVILFLLANKMNWKFSVTDVISIVFMVLILLDPHIIYHIGFQLSFCVTLGLLLSKNWLSQTTISFFSVLNIGFVSQMMILPLQVEYFFTFQPLSILLNLIVVPYFSLFVIPFMFLLLLMAPAASSLVSYADAFFVMIHEHIIAFIAFIDQTLYFPWVIGSFPIIGVIVYYGLFLALMKNLELKQLKQAFKYGCYLTALIMMIVIRPYFSPFGNVTMLDIGQGDAIVMELPYRKGVILIDAGAQMTFEDNEISENVYKQIIRPYLYSRGISRIDAVFISHADIDHMGSLPFMVDDMAIDQVIVSNYYTFSEQLSQRLAANGAGIIRARAGEIITIGDQPFYVLSPEEDRQNTNENSLVLYTEMGGKTWFFTGDIGSDTEMDIINKYPGLTADVLKVAHHGSSTSTDPMFLKHLQPAYGLISAGENNMYGHPHSDVIQGLEDENIRIFRTDESGAIHYYFKESEGTFSTYLP